MTAADFNFVLLVLLFWASFALGSRVGSRRSEGNQGIDRGGHVRLKGDE